MPRNASLKLIKTYLGTVQSDLKNAISYIETKGQSQLRNAKKAVDRYGNKSKKLSDLATEVKQLVDGQEGRMNKIKTLSDKTRNLSKQALNEANEAIFGGTFFFSSTKTLNLSGILKNQFK